MTRKHYKAIAEILRVYGASGHIVGKLAAQFEQWNPGFDRLRFFRACGMQSAVSFDAWTYCLDHIPALLWSEGFSFSRDKLDCDSCQRRSGASGGKQATADSDAADSHISHIAFPLNSL